MNIVVKHFWNALSEYGFIDRLRQFRAGMKRQFYPLRFFVWVWHETIDASSGNKHFFTKQCHWQTYQNYEQSQQELSTLSTLKGIFFQKLSLKVGHTVQKFRNITGQNMDVPQYKNNLHRILFWERFDQFSALMDLKSEFRDVWGGCGKFDSDII